MKKQIAYEVKMVPSPLGHGTISAVFLMRPNVDQIIEAFELTDADEKRALGGALALEIASWISAMRQRVISGEYVVHETHVWG